LCNHVIAMSEEEIAGWFAGRLPADWFTGPPRIEVDDEEVWVIGPVDEPEIPKDAGPEAIAAARAARAQRFREESREQRMRLAHEAQRRFGRLVAWGVTVGGDRHMFTRRSVPVMTRLHLPERAVLDTLVDAGVARSRSEALAWCVRLVGKHQADWIKDLREALSEVEQLRRKGPV
jgi:GTP1/Obg family GTP-binding protein